MIKHRYPPWHKPAQRFLFILGAIILITLPALYGTTDAISSETLALVVALYFGFWIVFSIIVRFAVPSARVESTLPTYTHEPAPTPVLHTPNKNAVPVAPAIRIHSSGSEPALLVPDHEDPHQRPRKATRFAPTNDNDHGYTREPSSNSVRYDIKCKNTNEEEAVHDGVSAPTIAITVTKEEEQAMEANTAATTQAALNDLKKSSLNVTFEHQGRPHNLRMDSSTSDTFPTFAAYRQAQHGNFDAFAQRIKNALLQAATTVKVAPGSSSPAPLSSSLLSPPGSAMSDLSDKDLQMSCISTPDDHLHPPPIGNGGAGSGTGTGTSPLSGRSRSTSAASVLSDIAEKIRSGTMLLGRSISRSQSQRSGFQQHFDADDAESGHEESGDTPPIPPMTTTAAASTTIHRKKRSRAVSDASAFLTVARVRHQNQRDASTSLRPPMHVRSRSTEPGSTFSYTTKGRIQHEDSYSNGE
ncbi:hypothetical protein BGZ73_004287 [Actinomortierella ambigua]|nr:hypothetical protein BGZ73_004287 [Actinomortierella ambigua]